MGFIITKETYPWCVQKGLASGEDCPLGWAGHSNGWPKHKKDQGKEQLCTAHFHFRVHHVYFRVRYLHFLCICCCSYYPLLPSVFSSFSLPTWTQFPGSSSPFSSRLQLKNHQPCKPSAHRCVDEWVDGWTVI